MGVTSQPPPLGTSSGRRRAMARGYCAAAGYVLRERRFRSAIIRPASTVSARGRTRAGGQGLDRSNRHRTRRRRDGVIVRYHLRNQRIAEFARHVTRGSHRSTRLPPSWRAIFSEVKRGRDPAFLLPLLASLGLAARNSQSRRLLLGSASTFHYCPGHPRDSSRASNCLSEGRSCRRTLPGAGQDRNRQHADRCRLRGLPAASGWRPD